MQKITQSEKNSVILKNSNEPNDSLVTVARLILGGDCVAVPTETVYGLAANALDEKAVRKIFEIKGRPLIDPLIVHIYDIESAKTISHFSALAEKIAEKFWPGPLTIVLPKKEIVPSIVSANLNTVAVRMPKHPLMRALLKECKVPLAAPSANPFGYVSPTKAEHVQAQLGVKLKAILDGGQCSCGLESTIISLVDENKISILRHGPIAQEEIEDFLKIKLITPEKNPARPEAPGMMKQHYSPNAKFSLFDGEKNIAENFDGAVIFIKKPAEVKSNYYWLSEDGNLEKAAFSLFDLIRSCDNTYKNILCEKAKGQGIALAINDRLSRASAK